MTFTTWAGAWAPGLNGDEQGQDTVEYALLISIGTLATFALLLLVGPTLQHAFGHIVTVLSSI